MDKRTTLGGLESEDDAEPGHRLLVVFPSLWGRGHLTHRLGIRYPRTKAYDDQSNQTSQEDSFDQLEEARDVALLHSARYQQSLRRYHARRVRPQGFQVGDLVLWLRQDARGRHKLTPPWEGLFIIAKILKPGTYKLANDQGEVYSNAWNIEQLCRFYP
jgi:hypothetical protein